MAMTQEDAGRKPCRGGGKPPQRIGIAVVRGAGTVAALKVRQWRPLRIDIRIGSPEIDQLGRLAANKAERGERKELAWCAGKLVGACDSLIAQAIQDAIARIHGRAARIERACMGIAVAALGLIPIAPPIGALVVVGSFGCAQAFGLMAARRCHKLAGLISELEASREDRVDRCVLSQLAHRVMAGGGHDTTTA